MRTGFITTKVPNNNNYTDENFNLVGLNTGNIVFINAIKKMFKCDYVNYAEVSSSNYDNYITPFFIWIRENEDKGVFEDYIRAKNEKIVLMSVGLQCRSYKPDFKLHDNTVKILKELEERCTLGVRGEYTASILDKYGIRNIQIIGCPSLYSTFNPQFSVDNEFKNINSKKVVCNYKTLLDSFTSRDIDILGYLNKHSDSFVDQTKIMITKEKFIEMPSDVRDMIDSKRQVFFTMDSWSDHIRKFDFSIGARFHGNVMAILNNIPALILTCDSRTKEMADFFSIPNINLDEFDISKPIEYYYEKADYSEFNKNYSRLYKDFLMFAEDNGLELNI